MKRHKLMFIYSFLAVKTKTWTSSTIAWNNKHSERKKKHSELYMKRLKLCTWVSLVVSGEVSESLEPKLWLSGHDLVRIRTRFRFGAAKNETRVSEEKERGCHKENVEDEDMLQINGEEAVWRREGIAKRWDEAAMFCLRSWIFYRRTRPILSSDIFIWNEKKNRTNRLLSRTDVHHTVYGFML